MYVMNLNTNTFQNAIKNKGVNTVIIPIGVLEAHGEHLALGTDTIIPREFVRRIEAIIGDKVMIAPEVAYGHSWATAGYPGTIDLPNDVFEKYITAIGEQFIKQGLNHIVLFNGHNGNIPALSIVSEKLADCGACVLTINWWLDYQNLIVKYAPGVGHAGEDETSCMLTIDPTLVQLDLAKDANPSLSRRLKFPNIGLRLYPHANNGNPSQGTVEKGNRIFYDLVPEIVKDIEQMWKIDYTV
jgi:creatinine amidohydrolase